MKIFEPSKVMKVDKILEKYRGQEEFLIAMYMDKYKAALEKREPDAKTWKTGAPNTYQMLPQRDLGD